MRLTRQRRRMTVAIASAAALFGVAACGNGNGGGDQAHTDGDITLSIHVFGGAGFGYDELIAQYMDDNPGIIVDYQVTTDDYDNEYRPTLIQELDAGSAPDIAAVEEQGIGQMMAMHDAWIDLAQYGLDARESDYPAWKWELGHTTDGTLAALGTDVGGMGMCYRTDVFAAAGLPTDRDEVAALWPTWDDFVAVAREFVDSGVDAAFIDSPNQIYNVRLVQAAGGGDGISYFDRDGTFVLPQSPAVRTAFDFVLDLHQIGAIGPFQNWQPEWFSAMDAGGFATMGCPAWMTGVIRDNSGEHNSGNWDIAPVPGGGGGNWGGSWLGVTAYSDHPAEAAALVDYLTSATGQLGAWQAVNNFPSSPQAQADPSVADRVDEYFNDAPIGEIFANSVQAYEPVFYGALHSAVRTRVEDVLFGVVEGAYGVDEAWDAFIKAGQDVVDLEG